MFGDEKANTIEFTLDVGCGANKQGDVGCDRRPI
jgi:hypothetical protein